MVIFSQGEKYFFGLCWEWHEAIVALALWNFSFEESFWSTMIFFLIIEGRIFYLLIAGNSSFCSFRSKFVSVNFMALIFSLKADIFYFILFLFCSDCALLLIVICRPSWFYWPTFLLLQSVFYFVALYDVHFWD